MGHNFWPRFKDPFFAKKALNPTFLLFKPHRTEFIALPTSFSFLLSPRSFFFSRTTSFTAIKIRSWRALDRAFSITASAGTTAPREVSINPERVISRVSPSTSLRAIVRFRANYFSNFCTLVSVPTSSASRGRGTDRRTAGLSGYIPLFRNEVWIISAVKERLDAPRSIGQKSLTSNVSIWYILPALI